MRTLIFALIPTLLVACSDDTTASATAITASSSSSGGDPSTDPGTSSPSTSQTTPSTDPSTSIGSDSATDSGPTTTAGPTTDSGTTTTIGSSSGGDSSTSLDPGTGTSTGEPGTSTSDSTTGGVVGCGMEGPEVDATLVHIGVDPGCGAIEFTGQNNADSPGPIYALDGCPCGANCLKPDPWTFTLDLPKDWQPGKLPKCPRIVVERQKSKAGCELVGVSIWDAQNPGVPARFHAGSMLGPIVAAQAELKIEQLVAEECDCDNCCSSPTRLDLRFTALGDDTTVAEGAEGSLANNQSAYQVKNFQSHLSGICDDSPHVDWAMRAM